MKDRMITLRRIVALALALPLALALAACGSSKEDDAAPPKSGPIAAIAPPAGQQWGDVASETKDGGFVSVGPMGAWLGPPSLDQGGQYQPGSGLGLAMWRLRGVYGITAQTMPAIERQGNRLVASAMYGASITADHLVRGFISKKAA